MTYALIAVIVLALMVIIPNIRIVPQSKAFILERLGGYMCTWSVGLHVKIPFIDRIANKVSLKERVLDFKPQPVITKDNVTMMIDTVIYFQITDPKLFTYGVENPMNAIENLSATTLRNIIGELELDGTLTSRDVINTRMRSILDEATAALDPENETLIQHAIGTLIKGKTVIVIAHRLRTVENADKIIVLNKGVIAETGAHAELMEKGGIYREMYRLQRESESWSA